MPFEHSIKSPGRRRSRSRTPHGHRRRDPSVETIRANGEEETNSQYLRRYGRAEPMTAFRNSSGPGLSSDSIPGGNGNSQTKAELFTRLAESIHENRTLNEENTRVEGEKERLSEEIDKLVEENASLHRRLESHQLATEDMASTCASLRNELGGMRQAIANANQGPGWSKTLGNMIHGTRASQRSEQAEVSELRTKVAEYKKHIQGLEAEIGALHHKTTEQARQIQDQGMGFAQELDDLRSKAFVKGTKHSDTEIQGKWNTLSFSIRQFVSTYLPAASDGHTAKLLAQHKAFRWLPETALTLQAPMLCHVALESWIWHFLCFRVFDSHSKFWAGEAGSTFSAQCEQLRGIIADGPSACRDAAVAQFHDWRVRTAGFITKLASNDEASSITSSTDEMLELLGLVTPSLNAQGEVRSRVRQDLLEIIRKAAQMASIFRTLKADFHVFITRIKLPLVHPPSFNFPFDAETMEYVKTVPILGSGESATLVDLAVSPGILKAGTSDGANYDSERILVKLQALCNLRPFLELLYGGEEKRVPDGGPGSLAQAENGCIKTEDQWGENVDEMVMIKTEPWQ